MSEATDSSGGSRLKLVLIAAAVVAVLALARYFNVQEYLRQALEWIRGLGPWAPVAFAGVYVLAAVFLLPGALLTLGAGVLFGVVKGSVVVIFSATLAATAAFLIGRYVARDWVAKKIEGNEKFSAIDKAVADEGWKIVGLTRLSPIFPYNLLNYAYGITRVTLRDYVLASFFGMMPGTVMYVYLGSLAGDLANLGASRGERTPAEWALLVVGLVATIVVTLYVTKIARRALEKRVPLEEGGVS